MKKAEMKKAQFIGSYRIITGATGTVKLIVKQPYTMFKGRSKTILNFNSTDEFDIYWKNNIKKELERIKKEEENEEQDTSVE